jgi:hypothetical protein
LQEITLIYPQLHPPELNAQSSNRVCNALALLQCVASHPETRELFLKAHVPLFLYPFLNTTSKTRPFEYLRLTSLGVIGALVKNDDSKVRSYDLEDVMILLIFALTHHISRWCNQHGSNLGLTNAASSCSCQPRHLLVGEGPLGLGDGPLVLLEMVLLG